MKKLRYIIGAAVFALCSLAFAQQSNTNQATQRLYDTDVDDFMSVTDFSNVEPENIFAFTNFQTSRLDLGAAKKFGSVYTGLYFYGWFNKGYSTSLTTEAGATTYTGTIKGSGSGVTAANINSALGPGKSNYFTLPDGGSTNSFTTNAIIGINNLGIKLNFSLNPKTSYTLKYADGTDTIEYKLKNSSTTIGIEAGTKLDKETFVLKPWGKISWTGNSNHSETISTAPTATVTTKENNGDYNDFYVTGGVGMETKKEDLTHTFDVALSSEIILNNKLRESMTSTNPLVTPTETTQESMYFIMWLDPSYKLQFDPEERFSIALKADLPIRFQRYSQDPLYVDNIQQNYEYSSVDFRINPSLNVAARWFAIPDKLTVNIGTKATFEKLLWYQYEAKAHESANNNWTFLGNGVSLDATTGVSFNFAKGITLDTYFDIIKVYNGEQGAKLDGIWNTAMSFQLSVKL